MKLDEKNIDNWLNNKLKDGTTPLENSLLDGILEKNKNLVYARKLLLYLNTAFVFVLITGAVYLFHSNEGVEIYPKNYLDDARIKDPMAAKIEKTDRTNFSPSDKTKGLKNELKRIEAKNQFLYQKPIMAETSLFQVDSSPAFFNYPKMIPKELRPDYEIGSISDFSIVGIFNQNDSSVQKKSAIPNKQIDTSKEEKQSNLLDFNLVKVLKHPQIRISLGIGSVVNQTKIINNTPDLKFTNKYYQNTVSQAFGRLTGSEINTGIILEYRAFSISGAMNYSKSGNILIYSIPIREVPLIDINGEIKGYKFCGCMDSVITQSAIVEQKALSFPMSIAIKKNLPRHFLMEIGFGASPNIKSAYFKLPGKADMRSTTKLSMKPFISIPINLQWGVYKTFPSFTLGLNGVLVPFYSSKIDLPGEQVLKTKQTSIRLSLIKNIKL